MVKRQEFTKKDIQFHKETEIFYPYQQNYFFKFILKIV